VLSPSNNNRCLETFETTAVEDEIREPLAQQDDIQGREVEYWKVLDRIKIVRIKG
jgi:translation initiation factor 5A